MFSWHCLLFYFKFSKNEFLRIGVDTNYYGSELGKKIVTLIDFLEVLIEEYRNSTVFYITKDDNKEILTL